METLRLIGYALRQRCKHDQNYALARWERWVLTAKCIVSLLVGQTVPECEAYREAVAVAYYDWAQTHSHEWGTGADGMVLVVARYGMGANTYSDGWP